MNDSQINEVVVFRTGQLFEIDMAANVLKENDIPHHTREETSSGLRVAMPAAPATGPGVWWCLLVPHQHVEDARKVLEPLPFCQGTDPEYWGFNPRPKVKLGWKLYAGISLMLFVIIWLIELLR